MKKIFFILPMLIIAGLTNHSCSGDKYPVNEFKYEADKFADLRILRYQVPGFEELELNQKKLIYFLSQAALCGRDIIFDQYGKYNLAVRRTLENIVNTYGGPKDTEDYKKFMVYTKRVWFSNGIHHHYSEDKFDPGFSEAYFRALVENSDQKLFPVKEGQTVNDLMDEIIPVMFNPGVLPKRMNQDTDTDIVQTSAVNFYEGVSQEEVEAYYAALKNDADTTPVSYGLNSRVVKENGKVKEDVYHLNGLYGQAIEKIVYWLEKAATVAETEQQKKSLEKLIAYYKTGDLEIWDEYNILWVKDLESRVDGINGFIETYGDPLGMKATWEALVNFKNIEATQRTETISENAQWFEDNSPVDDKFKKKEVKGVSAKVITAAQLAGDCYPATPIGINLPNADWIRKEYGSKSVTIDNITFSYYKASIGDGFYEEFLYDDAEVQLMNKYGYMTDNLHTDLHECLGHGSGQLLQGVSTDALKNYHSPLEEARADLFALYYLMDQKLLDLGLLPDKEAPKAAYIDYIQNGLMTQVRRIELGKDVEQAHMRCRQLISKWVYEQGKAENVIEKIVKDGKTFFRINDFDALRNLFGELLKEVQRIKSEGDYESGKLLVENYGVKIDYDLHKEIRDRYAKLNLAPFSGFINPVYRTVEKNGEIVDIQISYPDNYTEQMLYYSNNYSFLPTYNNNTDAAGEFQAFLDDYEATVKDLSVRQNKAYFAATVSGNPEDYQAAADLELAHNKIHADADKYQKLKQIKESGAVTDPLLARQLDVIHNAFLENQMDEEKLAAIIELQNDIEQKFSTFRANLDGVSKTENELKEVLKKSRDSKELERAWKASKQIGAEVAGDIVILVKMRNSAAQGLGFRNYQEMQLSLGEQDPETIEKLFDDLDNLTRDIFAKTKAEADRVLAEQYGIPESDLKPWHYQNPFFQEAPRVYDVDLDRYYTDQDIEKLTKDYFAGIGLPIDDIIARSDLYEKEGKYQHAYCMDVDREGDVRVICNLKPNYQWMNTNLHEFGHAVYDKYMRGDIPWVLREPAHPFTTEAIAMLFGRLASNAGWIQEMVGITEAEASDISDAASKMLRLEQLVFSRWVQVMYRFEKGLYENPDQDLNTLWWDLVEKYQMLTRPEDRNEPDWAAKIHVALYPVYYHNYILGELLASQLFYYISDNILAPENYRKTTFIGNKGIGEYLTRKVFNPGNTMHWDKMIESATGEGLTPKYYARQFVE